MLEQLVVPQRHMGACAQMCVPRTHLMATWTYLGLSMPLAVLIAVAQASSG